MEPLADANEGRAHSILTNTQTHTQELRVHMTAFGLEVPGGNKLSGGQQKSLGSEMPAAIWNPELLQNHGDSHSKVWNYVSFRQIYIPILQFVGVAGVVAVADAIIAVVAFPLLATEKALQDSRSRQMFSMMRY
ncbi:hypothetical protein Q8A73_020054 [Channa argus]|nr:hypothetical protein Q8A73_020054 [Channa argus]